MDAAAVGLGDLLRVIGALAVLVPLAYLTTRLVGSRSGIRSRQMMRILDTLPLGPGRALYLVEVGGRALVIGVAGQQIHRIATIDDPEVLAGFRRHAGRGSVAQTLASGWFRWGRGQAASDRSTHEPNERL
ncbi:MAG: flagellar biosynthetic protein FliO [Bacillota bacterium]